jgi:hypothetical protein
MPTSINFGLEFMMSLVVFGLLAKSYAWPYLRGRDFSTALLLLLSPFLVRYLGLMSLVPGVVDVSVTESKFAFYQAYGDFIAFVLALIAFVLVRSGKSGALVAVWIANVFGSIEFLNSVIRGSVSGTGGSIGAFWYIPVAYVPLGLVAHTLIFVLLLTRSHEFGAHARGRTAIASEGR